MGQITNPPHHSCQKVSGKPFTRLKNDLSPGRSVIRNQPKGPFVAIMLLFRRVSRRFLRWRLRREVECDEAGDRVFVRLEK